MRDYKAEIEAKEQQLDAVRYSKNELIYQMRDELKAYLAEAEKRFRAERREEYEKIQQEEEAVVRLEGELAALRDEAARNDEKAPHKNGTLLVKTVGRGRPYSRRQESVYGFFEVVTSESKFAANLASYSRPGVGGYIVRERKKDGSAGLKFHRYWDGFIGDKSTSWRVVGDGTEDKAMEGVK